MGLFGRKKRDLVLEGIPGTATIRSAERDERIHKVEESDDPILADIGIGTRKYRLELDVQLDDHRAPYVTDGRFKVPLDIGELDMGMKIPVRADADDPSRVALIWDAYRASPEVAEIRDGFDAEERARVHDGFPAESRKQMLDGWITATHQGAMSRKQLDEALDGMVQSGVLTTEEAAAARAAVGTEGAS
jgi:hypothetical protein